jgi:hypothetical protein
MQEVVTRRQGPKDQMGAGGGLLAGLAGTAGHIQERMSRSRRIRRWA